MRTTELRRFQATSLVDGLLREVVQSTALLPECAMLLPRYELSAPLRRIVAMATNIGQSWTAWGDAGGDVWLCVAEVSRTLSSERVAPVLQVDMYDAQGDMRDTGKWVRDGQAHWRRLGRLGAERQMNGGSTDEASDGSDEESSVLMAFTDLAARRS
jgi:hypothetical protein